LSTYPIEQARKKPVQLSQTHQRKVKGLKRRESEFDIIR